jgi:NAD(P)-dependent dehydrogenase (short-subunit alcohol dehydrogenase family)
MTGLLERHIAVVTGGGSGIGRAIALGYAREGAQVAVLDADGDTAAATVKAITGAGGKALSLRLDVTERDNCREVAAQIGATIGQVSIRHGVLGFTRALAAELGKDGVRVNAIGPGLIETPLNEKVRANNPELVKIFMDHTPLGRTGKPEDIVGPAIFLASDLSAYVTGSIIMADGGYRLI